MSTSSVAVELGPTTPEKPFAYVIPSSSKSQPDESTPLLDDSTPAADECTTPPAAPADFSPTLIGSPEQPVSDIHSKFGWNGFLSDISSIHSGTVPVSVMIATIIGILCGIAAFLYYALLEYLLHVLWHQWPHAIANAYPSWSPSYHWVWIPAVGMTCAVLVGTAIVLLGFPGDLPYTVKCVHKLGYVPIDHAPSMVAASQLSILGGGSLGPEAPLVAICASIAGWVSMRLFNQRFKNVVRKHTLCGMACALAAFFGVPLGGSLFALEINNRLGYEYFEHAIEAILSGTICLVVFRSLARLPIGPIYAFTPETIKNCFGSDVLIGALLGLIGAFIASLFAMFHWTVLRTLRQVGINSSPVKLAIFGGIGICTLGVLIPQTMFWGEYEMQTIGSLSPASKLVHIWPTSGAFGFEITGFYTAVLVGIAKLIAVSFTVSGGYRGGYIFPFFAAGAAFGRAFWYLFPSVSPAIAILGFAAGINVAITRTVVATPLILCALAGEGNAIAPVLAASLASLFVTYYMVSRFKLRFRFFFPHMLITTRGRSVDLSRARMPNLLTVRSLILLSQNLPTSAVHHFATRARGYRRSSTSFVHSRTRTEKLISDCCKFSERYNSSFREVHMSKTLKILRNFSTASNQYSTVSRKFGHKRCVATCAPYTSRDLQ